MRGLLKALSEGEVDSLLTAAHGREGPEGLRLTDLLAVVVSDEELVLTRITGDLTTLALDAFQESMGDSILRDALDDSGVLPTEVEPDDGLPVDAGP